MHRYVWEFYNGSIEKGYEVHHKDGDKSNNTIENLELLTVSEHKKLHGNNLTQEQREWRRNNLNETARPKAIEWHKSEEGRIWHSEHAKAQVRVEKELVCKCCGKTFKSVQSNAKYCSHACKAKFGRKNKMHCETRICPVCGKEFLTNKYRGSVRCSKSCAMVLRHSEVKKQKEVET